MTSQSTVCKGNKAPTYTSSRIFSRMSRNRIGSLALADCAKTVGISFCVYHVFNSAMRSVVYFMELGNVHLRKQFKLHRAELVHQYGCTDAVLLFW